MKILRLVLALLLVITFVVANFSVGKALTSSLVQITNFGTNPSGLGMYVYIPTTVKAKPPILVVVHWCTGSAQAIFSGTQFASLADQYGFIVVYPSAVRSGNCFDVSSTQALTRGGGSDPVGIMSMVTYASQQYNGDMNQVYVTGLSSGAMMTNVLLGDYPDVFKAGAAFAGVPFGCFATTAGDPTNPANQAGWNSTCSSGQMIKTAQEWGNLVRGAYPGYTGPYPRMQLWHGTEDTALAYPNFGEEIKQWTNVNGVSQTPNSTDFPQSAWTRTRYTNNAGVVVVEAISEQGVTHSISYQEAEVLRFFGLDGSVAPTAVPSITPGGPTLTHTRTPTITNTPVLGLQMKLQSGGTESTSISNFNLQLSNTGAAALSNLSWRFYFNTENGNAASSYVVEKYYDQSAAATITGPTLACGSTYYYTVTYGVPLAAGATWSFNSALHLSSYATTVDFANDWWHSGYAVGSLPAAFTATTFFPAYTAGSLLSGGEPVCSGSTPTIGASPTTGPTSTRTPTQIVGASPTSTATRTNTPTRTLTPAISLTPTRTATTGPTSTRTNTPAVTNTITRTPTVGASPTTGPTATRTMTPAITPTSGTGTCSPVTSTITVPFTFDGAGTFCWQSSNLGGYINNWNNSSVTINGVNITNLYMASGSYPAKIGGFWYVALTSTVSYGHFEAK